MALAFLGWNYGLVLPLAASAIAFSVFARRRLSGASALRISAHSVGFWSFGLALCVICAALFMVAERSETTAWSWSGFHKAVGLGLGALVASYLPFALVLALSSGRPRRSAPIYAAVTAALMIPLLLALPLLSFALAVFSCALLLVQSCM